MKIALVHDDFCQNGGAEGLFAAIANLFPEAPIYTSLVDWNKLPVPISQNRVRPSFVQKIPFATKFYKVLLPLYPLAFESFNFDEYDVVISSTTRFAKSIITKPSTVHICFINNIPRFLWNKESRDHYMAKWLMMLTSPVMFWLKRWDKVAASRPDYYIANSQNVSARLKKCYGRQTDEIIYPFADLNFFKIPRVHNWELKSQNYFLVVSRLVKWKRIELAVKACAELKKNLIIVGTGPDMNRLQKIANVSGGNSQFLGWAPQVKLRELYQNCTGFIVTQQEDFGIAAVEAQACGAPVIAFKLGGLKEIAVDGESGLFFTEPKVDSLKDAITRASKVKWNKSAIRRSANRFSKNGFENALTNTVNRYASNLS